MVDVPCRWPVLAFDFDFRSLILASVAISGDAALAQVRFELGAQLVRCEMKIAVTAG